MSNDKAVNQLIFGGPIVTMNDNQPMALITDQRAEGAVRAKKQSGFDLIITKPLDMKRVLKDVEAVLREHGGVP